MSDQDKSEYPNILPVPVQEIQETWQKCGDKRIEYLGPQCLTCGCWGDMHPEAGSVGGGPNCVCTNLHYQGHESQEEYRLRREKEKGHYIRQAPPPASHYCQTPQSAYSRRGEIWECDVCHQQWIFRHTRIERSFSWMGRWVPKRGKRLK